MKSQSEEDGINALSDEDIDILSVGISTGGAAEIRMLSLNPKRKIVATTVDESGTNAVSNAVNKLGLSSQIEVRLEDIASDSLPYEPETFDFVYARLVLHYLSAQALKVALNNIHSVLRFGGRFFVVVRSEDCKEAQQNDNFFDPTTKLTTYTTAQGNRKATRYFHSKQSITDALTEAGFLINSMQEFDEKLSPSFGRDSGVWVQNNVIEVIAKKGS